MRCMPLSVICASERAICDTRAMPYRHTTWVRLHSAMTINLYNTSTPVNATDEADTWTPMLVVSRRNYCSPIHKIFLVHRLVLFTHIFHRKSNFTAQPLEPRAAIT